MLERAVDFFSTLCASAKSKTWIVESKALALLPRVSCKSWLLYASMPADKPRVEQEVQARENLVAAMEIRGAPRCCHFFALARISQAVDQLPKGSMPWPCLVSRINLGLSRFMANQTEHLCSLICAHLAPIRLADPFSVWMICSACVMCRRSGCRRVVQD